MVHVWPYGLAVIALSNADHESHIMNTIVSFEVV